MKIRIFSILLIPVFILTVSNLSAQDSTIYRRSDEADTLAKHEKYQEALNIYEEIIQDIAGADITDFKFVGQLYLKAGSVAVIANYDLPKGLDYFNLGMVYIKIAGETNLVKDMIDKVTDFYDIVRDTDYQFPRTYSKENETTDIYVGVTKILKKDGLDWTVELDAGYYDGLYEGGKGEALGVYMPDFNDRGNMPLGSVEIISLSSNKAEALVKMKDTTKAISKLYSGDMALLPARKKKSEKKTIIYELALKKIEFLTNERTKLYHPRYVLHYDNEEINEEIIAIMKDDVVETLELLDDDMLNSPTMCDPQTEGKFKGKSLKEAMSITTEEDIRSFLGFVKTFPGKYMGKVWKINETYATWIINGAPIGYEEMLNDLLAAQTDEERAVIFDKYKEDFYDGDFQTYWQIETEQLARREKFDEAYKILDVIFKSSNYYADTVLIGWAYFTKAKIHENENDPEAAVEAYKIALPLFEKTNNTNGMSFCINNIASAYNDLARYEEALEMFQKSFELKKKQIETDSGSIAYENTAKSLVGLGNSLMNLSRFKEAIEAFKMGIQYYEKARSIDGMSGIALLQGKIGDGYKKKALYNEAIKYYRQKLNSNKDLGDQLEEADALDEIAYVYSLMGEAAKANEIYSQAYELKMKMGDLNGAGFSLSNVAQTNWTLGKYGLAIQLHMQAIELRKTAGNLKGQAYSWKKLGGLYKDTGDPVKAIEAYGKAAALYSEAGDKKSGAEIFQSQGDNYYEVKDYQKAVKMYEEALQIFSEIKSQYDVADVLTSIGNCYYSDKKFKTAGEYFLKALTIQTEIEDLYGQMNNSINLGLVAEFFEADYQKAEKYYLGSINYAELTGSHSNEAYCENKLARFYDARSKYELAEEKYFSSLNTYRALNEKSSIAGVLIDIGYFKTRIGKFHEAEEYFNDALAISDSMNDRNQIASAYSGLSALNRSLGNFSSALEYEQKSLALSIEVNNDWGIAGSYIGLGNIYNGMGEYALAVKYYQQSDSLYKLVGVEASRAVAVNNTGTIFYWQGDYNNALERFNLALELTQKAGGDDNLNMIVLLNIGEVYLDLKNNTEAAKWIDKGLKKAQAVKNEDKIAYGLTLLGKLVRSENKFEEARDYFTQAYSIVTKLKMKEGVLELAYELGNVYFKIGDFEKSQEYLQKSIDISQMIGGNKFLWKSEYTLGEIYRNQGKSGESIAMLKNAIEVIEEIKTKVVGGADAQKLFASNESVSVVYESIITQLMKQGRQTEALEYLERGNADQLKDKLGKMDINFTDPDDKEAVALSIEKKRTVDQLKNQIRVEKSKPMEEQNFELLKKLEERVTIAEGDYVKFVNNTIKEKPYLKNHMSKSVNPIQFKAQKRNIPPDMAIVLYLIAENDLYVFAATSDSVFANAIQISRSEIDGKVSEYYQLVTHPTFTIQGTRGAASAEIEPEEKPPEDKDTFIRLSVELYDILIGPVEKALKGKTKIAFIPNGSLYYLPFHALGSYNRNGDFGFLVDRYNIFYSHQLNFLSAALNIEGGYKLFALGNADKSLPYAEEEVEDLRTIYPDALVYVQDEATKDKVMNSPENYNVLHIATHGILDYNSPENSYLLLAPNAQTGDDGKLKIEEVWSIPSLYNYNMVTLSACETAVTFELSEGWPITTASAFLDIGIPSVVATLWSVDDAATSLLMKKFYENLKTMSKIEALHNAQVDLASTEKYSHPFYWAPFQLVGKWQ